MEVVFNEAFFSGFVVTFSFILAIGAQNAFVLRQGIRKEHILAVCITCALSDTVLIITGIGGYQKITTILPKLDTWVRYSGALFLIGYGFKSFYNAFYQTRTLEPNKKEYRPSLFADQPVNIEGSEPSSVSKPKLNNNASLFSCVATALVFTWLNPHVYLDTVILVGSVSAKYSEHIFAFGLGAISSSWVFFFGLGYGARLLTPAFTNPQTWKMLDILIGLLMWIIAWQLLPH